MHVRRSGQLHSCDKALKWGREQQARVKPHLPNVNQIETWARENAGKYGWREKPVSTSSEHLEDTLTRIVSAIQQTSDRKARVFVNAVIGKLGGAMAVGGISGLVATFGAASTGTAIASLSGVATIRRRTTAYPAAQRRWRFNRMEPGSESSQTRVWPLSPVIYGEKGGVEGSLKAIRAHLTNTSLCRSVQ